MQNKSKFLVVLSTITLFACTMVSPLNEKTSRLSPPVSEPLCANASAEVRADHPTARLSECTILSETHFNFTINPERRVSITNEPINDAAWYGFRIDPQSNNPFRITLNFGDKKYRYHPKKSYDGVNWEPMPDSQVTKMGKSKAELEFKSETRSFYISAQEIFSSAEHDTWIRKTARLPHVTQSIIGQSKNGYPLRMLEVQLQPDVKKPYVVWVGRQHAPEVTGALALIPFTETVLDESVLSKRFLEHFNLLIVPMINPDGVDAGNWRFNDGGMDLNRDWGPFSQPETQAIKAAFERFETGQDEVAFFLDFHSTWRNLLYTQADDEPTLPPMFARDWVKAVDARLSDEIYPFTREARHNSGRPVSKNYMYETYGIAAITYEVGDKTPRDAIDISARIFAQEMMKLLLKHEAEK